MNNFWKNKNVLVTGHSGFKGSWLSLMLKNFDANIFGISSEPRKGVYELTSISSILDEELFFDLSGVDVDVNNKIKKFDPDVVFHFAAQSLVIKSYESPLETVKSNILAPVNLIESLHSNLNKLTLVIATTDKVYKNPGDKNQEDGELGGYDFYSNSKVGKELIIDAYKNHPKYKNFNFNKVRSGNVIGGGERGENRLFTDLINSINQNKPIELRNPQHIRPWQYVLDSLYGYLLIAQKSFQENSSETFNLNSEINNQYTVKDIAELFKEYSDYEEQITINENATYKEVDELRINSSKAEKDLLWTAKLKIPEIIKNIIDWESFHNKHQTPDYSLKEIQSYLSI